MKTFIVLLLMAITSFNLEAQTKKCNCKCHQKKNNYQSYIKKSNTWKVVGTRMGASLFDNYFYLIYKNDNDQFYEKQVSVGVYDYYYKETHPEKFSK